MKRMAFCGLVLCLAGAAPAAFRGNVNFRNVAITNAAQYRTDWRSCKVDGKMDWSKAETLGEGVIYLPLKLTVADGWARQMYCHAVRVDTSKTNVRFTGNERCEGWGEPNTEANPGNKTVLKNTVREKTADFIARFRGEKSKGGKARNMIFAVNGQGWGGNDGTGADYVFGTGWAQLNSIDYSDGILISRTDRATGRSSGCPGVFVVWKDGTIDIVDTLEPADVPRVWYAITPHMCRLMTDGEITVKRYSGGQYVDYDDSSVRPRTAYGISKDKRYFYAVVLDGDASPSWSAGATFLDTAKAMKATGCWQALNMDGGGSSNVVGWDGALDRPKVLGRPNGFTAGSQRDGGSHLGVYLASVVALVGDWRYDSADALVQDLADGEIPARGQRADVVGDLVFPSEKPTLPVGADFSFVSTNGATVAWECGEGQVAADTRVTFAGVRFAEGARTVSVTAGGRLVVGDCTNLETVKTSDAEGFVLGGALSGRLTVDCAMAKVVGAAFGVSELSYDETLRQLTNLVCASSPSLLACAERAGERIVLKWGGISFASNAVRIRKDDRTAVVTVEIAAVSPSVLGSEPKLALTVANDDGTSVDRYTKDFDGAGSYSFTATGAGFGYSYRVTLVDGKGEEIPAVGSTDGIFMFGTESEWFAADRESGVVRGGAWSGDSVFSASDSGRTGKFRIVSEVVLGGENGGSEATAAKQLAHLSDGATHAALFLRQDGTRGVWQGLVREKDAVAWRPLSGAEVEEGAAIPFVLIGEVDFSSGRPRVRYFAGPKSSGAVTLLSDAEGKTAFDGAGMAQSLDGVVSLENFERICSLAGYQRVKGTGSGGYVIYLVSL